MNSIADYLFLRMLAFICSEGVGRVRQEGWGHVSPMTLNMALYNEGYSAFSKPGSRRLTKLPLEIFYRLLIKGPIAFSCIQGSLSLLLLTNNLLFKIFLRRLGTQDRPQTPICASLFPFFFGGRGRGVDRGWGKGGNLHSI